MTVQVETLEGLERKIVLALPWKDINAKVEKKLRETQKRARIDGFRPGKAPMKMIASMYGASIQNDILNDAALQEFHRVSIEEKLKVAGLEKLEALENQDDDNLLKVAAVFEVYPEFVVGDVSGKEIERLSCDIGEAEVEKTIEILRKQRVRYEPVDRAAQNNDRVTVDFSGRIEGEVFEGGSAENQMFILGNKQLLPEFEAGIVGMKKGETKTVDVTFPEDYHGKNVAGKTANFTITLKEVYEAKLPEVDETFALSLGIDNGDVAKMREEILKNITREITRRTDEMTKENVMSALLDATDIDIPKALLREEIARLREDAKERFASQGLSKEQVANFPDEIFRERAQKRVALGLILSKLVAEHKLEASDEQVDEIIAGYAESYEDPDEVITWYKSDRKNMQGPTALAIENNIVRFILDQAKPIEKKLTFDEVMNPANIQV